MAWPKVTRPCFLGGFGISHFQFLGWALRMRWLWLQKNEPEKAWAFLPIKAAPQVKAFFAAAVVTVVGNGKNTLLWTDRWMGGQSLEHTLPSLFGIVTSRGRGRMVAEALHNRRWISDLRGALTVDVIFEYIQLWGLLENFELQPAVDDTHIWQFSTSGSFTTKSAYDTLFTGAIHFSHWERIWQS